jgi:hypothetical protein
MRINEISNNKQKIPPKYTKSFKAITKTKETGNSAGLLWDKTHLPK